MGRWLQKTLVEPAVRPACLYRYGELTIALRQQRHSRRLEDYYVTLSMGSIFPSFQPSTETTQPPYPSHFLNCSTIPAILLFADRDLCRGERLWALHGLGDLGLLLIRWGHTDRCLSGMIVLTIEDSFALRFRD